MGDGFLSIDACVWVQAKTAACGMAPLGLSSPYPHPQGVSTGEGDKVNRASPPHPSPLAAPPSSACRKHGVRVWTGESRTTFFGCHLYFSVGETCSIVHQRAVIPLVFRARAIRPMRTHPFRMVSLQSISTLTSAVANRLMFACAARERIYLHAFYYR